MNRFRLARTRTLKSVIIFILIICSLFSVTMSANAANESSPKRQVKIGAFASSGYHHKNEDGSLGGYGFEYEALLAQYANWDITYVEGTWSELQQMLTDGEIDLLGFLVNTSERKELYDYADYPSGTSTSCLITGENNDKYAFEDYTAFNHMRIAYQEKNANSEALKKWCERKGISIDLVPYESYEEVYEAIDKGIVDAGLATNFYDLSDYKIIANIGSVDFYYAVTKGNTELFEELNQAVLKLNTFYPNIETTLYSKFYDTTNGRGDSFTSEELAYLATNPTITVCHAGRGAPFEYIDNSTGEYVGFVPDVLEELSKRTGIQFVYNKTEDNLPEYIQKTKDHDAITSMTCDPIWAQNKGFKITQPFITSTISIVTKSGTEDIKSVAMQQENYILTHICAQHPEWDIQMYDTMEERLNAVYRGKCDAAIMNSYEAEYYMSEGKYKLLSEYVTSDVVQNIAFAIPEGSNPLLHSIISKSLLMIDSDTYSNLMHDNMNYSVNQGIFSLIYTNPVQVSIVGALILLLVAAIIFMIFYIRSIRRKNRQIMEATQVKTDFFSRMSHDMRTPMNGILGMTALSKNERNMGVLQHNIIEIENSGKYMLNLINDMLDLQKLETGKLELNIQPIYSEDFVNGLIEMMKPTAEANDIDFQFNSTGIDYEHDVYLDQTRIKQAFTNILSNAFKFTPKGGVVRFTAEKIGQDGSIEHDKFCIIDSGIGMSKEFIENGIFRPYSQEDSTITTKYGGTGLGLAITKNIVESMGGSITVESTLGEGTCFTVFLDFEISEKKKSTAPVSDITEKNITPEGLKGKEILLCEDHPLNAEIAKRLLKKAGCKVVHAADGKKGVERFIASELDFYDAILMDIRMPNMDGLSATKAIRSLNRSDAKTVPIIAMTANAFEEDIRQCKDAGMNAHLAKPVEIIKLYSELLKYIDLNEKKEIYK